MKKKEKKLIMLQLSFVLSSPRKVAQVKINVKRAEIKSIHFV